MKIATFNVNSIKARLPNVLAWLKQAKPKNGAWTKLVCNRGFFQNKKG